MDAQPMLLLQLALLTTPLGSAGQAGAGPAPETAAEPGPRVRPRRPTRAQKGGYADNQDFMDEVCLCELRRQICCTTRHFLAARWRPPVLCWTPTSQC